jgi:hypothetical protein
LFSGLPLCFRREKNGGIPEFLRKTGWGKIMGKIRCEKAGTNEAQGASVPPTLKKNTPWAVEAYEIG